MPKTWNKGYDWILNHEQAFETNNKEFAMIVEEVKRDQHNKLYQIGSQIYNNRANLIDENKEIITKEGQLWTQRNELENEIEKHVHKHQKYTKKLKEAERELIKNENMIDAHNIAIESNEEMKRNTIKVQDEIEMVIKFANEEETKIDSQIGYRTTLVDLKSNLERSESKILEQNKHIDDKNIMIKDKINQQKKQSNANLCEVAELNLDIIDNNKRFIKNSWEKVAEIDNICDNIKNERPKYGIFELKNISYQRDSNIKELENIRVEYTELWRLAYKISKDKQLLESNQVRIFRSVYMQYIKALILILKEFLFWDASVSYNL